MVSAELAFEKAAACEQHARQTTDEKMQRMFRKLRDSWIRVGNKAQFHSDMAADGQRLNDQKSA
jgi:hypothetical protein